MPCRPGPQRIVAPLRRGNCFAKAAASAIVEAENNAENNAVLIGKNGTALQSLNTIVKAAASSEFRKRVGVLIDINGYKQEKYHKVCALAMRVAKDVRRTKTDAILDPMPADERKAIHNHLADMDCITTESEGEGNHRRLKIMYTPDKKKKD